MMKIGNGIQLMNTYVQNQNFNLARTFSLWAMKKDPDLEAVLSRNRRWIVNNQIKNIILRCPDHTASVNFLQKKFNSLYLQGKALNWLKKYPRCFEIYLKDDHEYHVRLTKKLMLLVQEEETVKAMQETVLVERLAKLLMMVYNHRLSVSKLGGIRRNFGLPDDYLTRIIPKHLDMFRVVSYGGRKNSTNIELIKWDPELAVSAIEKRCQKQGCKPSFTCSLPSNWVKFWERFNEFNSSPYVSPYTKPSRLGNVWKGSEKHTVGLLHEFLSLTLWKKASIMKLGHFKREFDLPEKLNVLLLKHPGIFYVTNKNKIYTVLLREGYKGSELVEKDPLVVVKDKIGELMLEGLREYNRRHRLLNSEKKSQKVIESETMKQEKNGPVHKLSGENGDDLRGIFDPEERKQLYKLLFEDNSH